MAERFRVFRVFRVFTAFRVQGFEFSIGVGIEFSLSSLYSPGSFRGNCRGRNN